MSAKTFVQVVCELEAVYIPLNGSSDKIQVYRCPHNDSTAAWGRIWLAALEQAGKKQLTYMGLIGDNEHPAHVFRVEP